MKKQTMILLCALVLMNISGCINKQNPLTDEEVKLDVRSNLIQNKEFAFKELLSYSVDASTLTNESFIQVIHIVFMTNEAEVTGKIKIEYYKGEKVWLLKSINLSETTGKAKEAPTFTDSKKMIDWNEQINGKDNFMFYFDGYQGEIKYSSKLVNFDEEKQFTKFEINATIVSLNFKGLITYVVEGLYNFETGWNYTILGQSYEEITDWNGSWTADIYTWKDGIRSFNQSFKIISTGKIQVFNDGVGHEEVINDTTAKFKIDGYEYILNGVYELDPNDGHAISRKVTFKYGEGITDQVSIGMSFITSPIDPTPHLSIGVGVGWGELIKLN